MNPLCDGGHCTTDHGEVRVFYAPTTIGENTRRSYLCEACWAYENTLLEALGMRTKNWDAAARAGKTYMA